MKDEQPRRTVQVDLEELRFAMEDASFEHRYFLDTETGEVILVSELFDDDEAREQLRRIDEAERGRYLEVPRADSHEGYGDMQDFIASVRDEHLQELLDVAIQGEARSAVSRMCWHAIRPSNSGGSTFRRGGWTRAPANGWLKKVVSRHRREPATELWQPTSSTVGTRLTGPQCARERPRLLLPSIGLPRMRMPKPGSLGKACQRGRATGEPT